MVHMELFVIVALVWLLIQLINLISPPAPLRQGLSIFVVAVAVLAVFRVGGFWPFLLR